MNKIQDDAQHDLHDDTSSTDERQTRRERLADLIGLLLARHWLATRSTAQADPDPAASTGPNSAKATRAPS